MASVTLARIRLPVLLLIRAEEEEPQANGGTPPRLKAAPGASRPKAGLLCISPLMDLGFYWEFYRIPDNYA